MIILKAIWAAALLNREFESRLMTHAYWKAERGAEQCLQVLMKDPQTTAMVAAIAKGKMQTAAAHAAYSTELLLNKARADLTFWCWLLLRSSDPKLPLGTESPFEMHGSISAFLRLNFATQYEILRVQSHSLTGVDFSGGHRTPGSQSCHHCFCQLPWSMQLLQMSAPNAFPNPLHQWSHQLQHMRTKSAVAQSKMKLCNSGLSCWSKTYYAVCEEAWHACT